MREAAVPGYRLSKARGSTKVLITLGLIGLLLGLLGAAAVTIAKTGFSPEKVRGYYLGTDEGDGVLSLTTASTARPFAELAEITHFHLVGGSMLLFFLCHLLSLCDIRDFFRTILYLVSFLSFLTTFSLPWLIIYCNPIFSWGFGPAVSIFILSLVLVSIIPLKDMWCPSKVKSDG